MRIDIISAVPELMSSSFGHSILKRAIANQLVEVNLINLRDYASNKQKQIDDYAFGGGAGMVLMIEPIDACLKDLKSQRTYDEIIYMSPDGELLNQKICNQLSMQKNIVICDDHILFSTGLIEILKSVRYDCNFITFNVIELQSLTNKTNVILRPRCLS